VKAELDVVIPVRDVDRYLGEALQSVRHQDVEYAVTVVDAGSITPIVLPPPFATDPRVRLIRSEVPLGIGAGRNRGAELTTAPWIAFLDADDRWPPRSRRLLLDACKATGADIAVGTVRTFYSDEPSRRLMTAEGVRQANLAGGLVMSRGGWDLMGPFDPTLASGEFIDWFLRAEAAQVKTVTIPDLVLERRLHLDSTTANQIGDRDDYLRVVRQWMNRTD
jgi:glycosyltransferase involved in cell wall biosynthesis